MSVCVCVRFMLCRCSGVRKGVGLMGLLPTKLLDLVTFSGEGFSV